MALAMGPARCAGGAVRDEWALGRQRWDAALQLAYAREQVQGDPRCAGRYAVAQSLIDHLVAASHELDDGDQQAALSALSGPDFSKPPAEILAELGHFPYVSAANSALVAASVRSFRRVAAVYGISGGRVSF